MKSAFYSQEYPVILSVLQEIKKRGDLGWKHWGPGVWGLNVSVLLPSQLPIYHVRWKDPPDIGTPSLAFFETTAVKSIHSCKVILAFLVGIKTMYKLYQLSYYF